MTQTTNNTRKENTYHKKLSIQFGLNGLSFCVLNTKTNRVLALEQVPFEKKQNPFEALERLMHYFEVRDYLKNHFDSIIVIHENNVSTLVPNSLFNADHLADYLKFNCKILQSDYLNYDPLQHINASNVYVPYVNANNYIYDAFGAFTFKHYSTLIIDTIMQKAPSDADILYVHIGYKHFEIISVTKGLLQFYNTFEYSDAQDFIYYVLFTLEQLFLDPETVTLHLLGAIDDNSALYHILYTYVRNVTIDPHQNTYTVPHDSTLKLSNFTILNSF